MLFVVVTIAAGWVRVPKNPKVMVWDGTGRVTTGSVCEERGRRHHAS